MSNWSVVILKWSSLDFLTPERVQEGLSGSEAFQSMDGKPASWVVAPGDRACEHVMVTHVNHFDPLTARLELRNLMDWSTERYLQSAFLIYENENMNSPEVLPLFPEIQWNPGTNRWERLA